MPVADESHDQKHYCDEQQAGCLQRIDVVLRAFFTRVRYLV